MRHRNTEMVIKVYSKYIENAAGFSDGAAFNEVIQVSKGTRMKHRENDFGQILGKNGTFNKKKDSTIRNSSLIILARPARLERAACGFEVRRSIQLSYGRTTGFRDE